ncbi:MAG TPA: pilus assembly protein PilM [Polyangiales bacterium]|nr:pilus assembly protein PilM [Polyangiales bacterium]
MLGIDVGPTALRGVLLRSAMRKIEVERYLEIPLTEAEDSPGRLPELAEAGRNLLAAAAVTPDSIVAAIAGEEASLRSVELPAAARKRIAEILPFELEALLPFEPRDAAIDFQPIGEASDGTRLMVAAVLRPKVSAAIAQLAHAGLEPQELAAGAAALDGLCQLLPELRGEGPFLLVDLGDRRTDLCMVANGYCIAARTVSIGLADMPGAAEDARSELQRTLAGFRGGGADAPAAVYVLGSGAVAEGGAAWLADVLELPVSPLVLPPANGGGTEPNASFGKAAALAARSAQGRRRINLRTGEFAPTQVRGQLLGQINLMVTCAVVIVVAAMFALKARQSLLMSEQDALSTELATVTKQVLGQTITDPVLAEAQVKNPKSNDPLPRFDAFDAVGALSSAIPQEISHEVKRLSIDFADEKAEGTFELQGSLESLGQRDEIVSALQKHPCFKEIELGRTNAAAGGQDRIAYQIEAKLECPGEAAPKKTTKKVTEAAE